jgi:hypothetical protein
MDMSDRLLPRSTFRHGQDCLATFIGRADGHKADVDVWEITIGGNVFHLRLMKMRPDAYRARRQAQWVFGSIVDPTSSRDIWRFRDDIRHQKGFFGDVIAAPSADGLLTEVVYTAQGEEKHRLPLYELLGLPRSAVRNGDVGAPLLRLVPKIDETPPVVGVSPTATDPPIITKRESGLPLRRPVVVTITPPMSEIEEDRTEMNWFLENVLARMLPSRKTAETAHF